VIATRSDGNDVRNIIKATAALDEIGGVRVKISLPQDPGQAGKVQAQDYVKLLAGYDVRAEPESGDKILRAEPFSAQCQAGNVLVVEAEWTEGFVQELCAFPSAALKDQVDASSGAFGQLTRNIMNVPIVAPWVSSSPSSLFPGGSTDNRGW
jgi:predicted phage terminase large subunit-like protein